jgi:hypothetical protein
VISLELRTEIRRLYYAEHWKVGTIASSLHVHHETVQTAIASETLGVRRGGCRASALDPYLPIVRDTLAQFPRLRATRLHEMLRARLSRLGDPSPPRGAAAAALAGRPVSPPGNPGGRRLW